MQSTRHSSDGSSAPPPTACSTARAAASVSNVSKALSCSLATRDPINWCSGARRAPAMRLAPKGCTIHAPQGDRASSRGSMRCYTCHCRVAGWMVVAYQARDLRTKAGWRLRCTQDPRLWKVHTAYRKQRLRAAINCRDAGLARTHELATMHFEECGQMPLVALDLH